MTRRDHDLLVAEMKQAGLVPTYFQCPTCAFRTVHWAPPELRLDAPPCGMPLGVTAPPGVHSVVSMERVEPFDASPHTVGVDVEA